MTSVEFQSVSKRFGARQAIAPLDLAVQSGELLAVFGPNGAGKTTLLKLITGLIAPDRGRILIGGRDVAAVPPERRGVSLQFQTLALFPDRTAYENLAFPLRQIGAAPKVVDRRVREIAERLRLTRVLERLPATFSGGEAQRVAIGRAVIGDSPVLLFDEPLSNLDLQLRRELRIEFRALQRDLGRTVVYVTHDRGEALSLGNRIAVLSSGRLLQVASPQDILRHPLHRQVASLLSTPRLNFVPAMPARRDGGTLLQGPGFAVELPGIDPAALPSDLVLAIAPQGLSLAATSGRGIIPAQVERVEFQGSYVTLHARAGGVDLRAIAPASVEAARGTQVFLKIDPAHVLIIDSRTETIIEQTRESHVQPVQ